ncbi:MAG: ABC transporter ATP-binding protein/permease [Coxiellaceae bacterium]|jgi:ATP-binding cassette subfamily C protein|nr:ABC transporter ATP-binding protein/permease [Coxiellaceae bacterium]
MSHTISILFAVKKILTLLSKRERLKWLIIIGFAYFTAITELVAASAIIVLATVLTNPDKGQQYLYCIKSMKNVPPNYAIVYIAVACGVIYFIKNVIAGAEVFYQNFAIQKIGYNFRGRLLNRYTKMDYGFYLTRNSSYGISVINQDVEQMFSLGIVSLAAILSELVIFICFIAMIIYMNPNLFGILFILIIIFGSMVYKFLLPSFYKWGQKRQEAYLFATRQLMQFFHGFKEILLFGKRGIFIASYDKYAKQDAMVKAIYHAANTLPRFIIELLFVGLFIFAVSYMCLINNQLSDVVGTLSGYLYLGFRIMPGLNRMIGNVNTFKYVIPSIERVCDEYFSENQIDRIVSIPEFKFEHHIIFRDVFFKYLNTEKNILKNINLEIKKGKCIGIVGETGSGKSTFVDLVLGILKTTSGEILVDGKYQVCSEEWHKIIGYVPQNIYLMDDTIEANIAFGEFVGTVDEIMLRESIRISQLDKFIKTLPSGVKTVVGERGIRLSGGEKQRIAIARALYRKPQVLIFDEATSSLDLETERRLMETINEITKNYTVIMVAHRLSTLRNCDEIFEISNSQLRNKVLST